MRYIPDIINFQTKGSYDSFNYQKIMKHTIPPQTDGQQIDASENITLNSYEEAQRYYEEVKLRLLQIDRWYEFAKVPLASFAHLDEHGQETDAVVKVGHYIRIDVPGPGLESTEGYDFVRVDHFDETDEDNIQVTTLTLRPSEDPLGDDSEETKHFFKNLATSSLQIIRVDNNIQANYFGRNEVVNYDVEALGDKFRNLLVGVGAKMGASYPQWKSLLKGLIAKPS